MNAAIGKPPADKSARPSVDRFAVTIADICRAIADGLLPAQQRNGEYTIREQDLIRLIKEGKVAPAYVYARRAPQPHRER